jgi:hypothetical protein
MAKKTWAQKREAGNPEVVVMDKSMWGLPPGTKLLISTPREVESALMAIPHGTTLSLPELRAKLADDHQADATCPMTTSMFVRIVAEYAIEQVAQGAKIEDVAPFWRVIGPKDKMVAKFTFDPSVIEERRSAEGID